MEDWWWIHGSSVSVPGAASACCDGLLTDVEVVAGSGGLFELGLSWWLWYYLGWLWGVVEEFVEADGHAWFDALGLRLRLRLWLGY